MSYKMNALVLALTALISPAAGFAVEQDLATSDTQISTLDSQIDALNKKRNEESFQALLIRRQIAAAAPDSEAAKSGTAKMEALLKDVDTIDSQIALLQKQRDALQAGVGPKAADSKSS